MRNVLAQAKALRTNIIMFQASGRARHATPARDALEDIGVNIVRMRLRHFGIKRNCRDGAPSRSRAQVASARTLSFILLVM